MTEEERRRFESLLAMSQAAYTRFNDRRKNEWQLNIAVWTGLSVVVAGLLQLEKFPLRGPAWIFALAMGLVVVGLHARWSHGAACANAIDKSISLHYNREMQRMLQVPFDEKISALISRHPKSIGWWQWTHLSQIALTAALATAICVIVFVRS